MKKTSKKFPKLLIVGLFVMNVPELINHLIDINGDIIDFFKGFGVALVFAGFWLSVKSQKSKQSTQS